MKVFAGITSTLTGLAMIAGPVAASDKDFTVELITLDPGHFHAALVQKFMLPGVSPKVRVFAPVGPDVHQHLARIESFNKRASDPTKWETELVEANNYLDRAMSAIPSGDLRNAVIVPELKESKGKRPEVVVVISGNNARKAEYITRSIEAGFNVLADKPMAIRPADFKSLEAAFALAREKKLLLYDIMTERFEITTMLQKELSRQKALFGVLDRGSPDNPSISKISVHNFSKVVAGAQLKRPQWFFDPAQQGAGIVDNGRLSRASRSSLPTPRC
jgi:hypothetical protein